MANVLKYTNALRIIQNEKTKQKNQPKMDKLDFSF